MHPPFHVLVLLLCFFTGTLSTQAADPPAEHVVLITVDGLPAFLFDDPSAVLPNSARSPNEGCGPRA